MACTGPSNGLVWTRPLVLLAARVTGDDDGYVWVIPDALMCSCV